jgi:glycosyltransferase involved in cell wall biosynthesis
MPFKPEWTRDAHYYKEHVEKVIAGEKWLFEHSRYVLAISNEIVSAIDREYGPVLENRSASVTTVFLGVGKPLDAPSSKASTVGKGSPVRVLFVGRLEARKGPDQLLSALLTLSDLSDRMEVTFVGQPEPEGSAYTNKLQLLRDALARKAPKMKLHFAGYVADSDLSEFYERADIFVAPSRFESFGLILIEAMRFGLPVIAGNIGGMREIIRTGIDGFLADVDDIAMLAGQLRELVTSPALRAKIGKAAQSTYEARFTAARMGEEMERMFRDAIETGAR